MSRIYTSVEQLIGRTPLLELTHVERQEGLSARVMAKLEFLNPAGSVKDRAALAMIEDAEAKGKLKPGSVIIEPTSGNRNWLGLCCRSPRLSYHHRHAGNDEHGAPPADGGLWCGTGTHRGGQRDGGCDCQSG